MMRTEQFKRGDQVVFTKTKFSAHPGPRAEDISPSIHGESYSYLVKKFWTVLDCEEHRVLVLTRGGKRHWLNLDDPALRAANWWELIRYRDRFPTIDDSDSPAPKAVNQN